MIEIYEGRIGSGKTFCAVVGGVRQLVLGGIWCTNIEVYWDEICKYAEKRFGVILEPDQLIRLEDEQIKEFYKYTPSGTPERPVLISLDEFPLHFDSRDFAENYKKNRETFTFARQSRKIYTDIVLIAQSLDDIDKKFRPLAQYVWRFRDLTKTIFPQLGIAFPLPMILALRFDYDGRTLFSRDFVPKRKEIFKLYNTNSLVRGFPRLEGIQTTRSLKRVQRSGLSRSVVLLLALIDLLLAALFFLNK